MAVNAISIADAKVGDRISVPPGTCVQPGIFVVRETMALESGCVGVELQPVDGGAPVEAMCPGDTAVGLIPHDNSLG